MCGLDTLSLFFSLCPCQPYLHTCLPQPRRLSMLPVLVQFCLLCECVVAWTAVLRSECECQAAAHKQKKES